MRGQGPGRRGRRGRRSEPGRQSGIRLDEGAGGGNCFGTWILLRCRRGRLPAPGWRIRLRRLNWPGRFGGCGRPVRLDRRKLPVWHGPPPRWNWLPRGKRPSRRNFFSRRGRTAAACLPGSGSWQLFRRVCQRGCGHGHRSCSRSWTRLRESGPPGPSPGKQAGAGRVAGGMNERDAA